jgi:hypothetical protein
LLYTKNGLLVGGIDMLGAQHPSRGTGPGVDLLVPSGGYHSGAEVENMGVAYPFAMTLQEENSRLLKPQAGEAPVKKARLLYETARQGKEKTEVKVSLGFFFFFFFFFFCSFFSFL